MCKIKSLDGRPLRLSINKETGVSNNGHYTAFEVEALKAAASEGVPAGSVWSFRTETNGFTVVENSASVIRLHRNSTGGTLEALKFEAVPAAPGAPLHKIALVGGTPATSPAPVVTTAPTAAPVAAAAPAAPAGGDAVQNAVDALLAAVEAQKAAAAPAIDADAVRAIVGEMLEAKVGEIRDAHTTRVVVNDIPRVELDGQTLHPQFQSVLDALADREIPYLYGSAGTGKTTLARQVAEALGLPFFCVGALQSKYELEGYRDATGNFCDTVLYKAMKAGGVFLFDEIDSTMAEVLVPFNALMANGYYTFPTGERVEAHENFRIICAGNTIGRGANRIYVGRCPLDASTLDRFGFLGINYCEAFDLVAARDDKNLVALFVSLRSAIKAQKLPYTASPRGLARISAKVARGWSDVDAIQYGLTGGWATNDLETLKRNVTGEGRWFDAFKAVTALDA